MSCLKNCPEVNVPEVDNSNRQCADCGYGLLECIVLDKGAAFGGVSFPEDAPLVDILILAFDRIAYLQQQIDDLQAQIDAI